MNWESPTEFFAMGGHGLYVWGSFGVTALALIIEPLLLKKRRSDALRNLKRELSAERTFKEDSR
jgi:heme exporter protein D